MNAIRCTTYPPTVEGTPDSYEPFMIVVLERDLREGKSLSEATMGSLDLGDQQGVFCVTEMFEVDDDISIEDASELAVAVMQPREQAERYMACLYQYETQAFAMASETATLMGTEPAPLDAEDVASTLRRIARHPAYKRQRVLIPTQDGYVATLEDGEVSYEAIDG